MKSYKHIPDSYLNYGKNAGTVHEFRTEARFYEDSFQALMVVAYEQFGNEITTM